MSISIIKSQTTNITQVLRYKLFLFSLMSVLMVTPPPPTQASEASYNHPFNFIETTGSVDSDTDVQATYRIKGENYECECLLISKEPKINECRCEGLAFPDFCCLPMSSLTITQCHVEEIQADAFPYNYTYLEDIVFLRFPKLQNIGSNFFARYPKLRTIYISEAPQLFYIRSDWFRNISPTFKTLRITDSGVKSFPDLSFIPKNIILHLVDFQGNQITELNHASVNVKTEYLILNNNQLSYIDAEAFKGSQIKKLSMRDNPKLKSIHSNAFTGIVDMLELDLSFTSLEKLPTDGLGGLEVLRIQKTHSLKQIPSLYFFKNLKYAYLTHSFHCCAFKFPKQHNPELHKKKLKWIEEQQASCAQNINSKEVMSIEKSDSVYDSEEDYGEFGDVIPVSPNRTIDARCGHIALEITPQKVQCHPEPDALNPCEDVMGFEWLRISVWLVVLMAVFGNIAVLVVLCSFVSEITVPRFLICNLAFADLCMGLFLLMLACIDLYSKGEYFNFAYDWQYGAGCKVAGFLTIFASHLSVFTLTVITLERWFAITHAIYLNRRIKLATSVYVMICGWIYALLMASLPLFGVSNYSSTSICLPMEARDQPDKIFLVTVLSLNGFAFIVILICYAKIYFSLGKETRRAGRRGPKGEMTVAKKMALLVFTNFLCWSPIAFFGLTALVGIPLIDITESKIILVFFYPINSCANPYLYAILTSQYRQDLYQILSKFGLCETRAREYRLQYSLPLTNFNSNVIDRTPSTKKSRVSIDDIHNHFDNHHGLSGSLIRKLSQNEECVQNL